MTFIVIGDSDSEKNTSSELSEVKKFIEENKHVFLMIFLNGCGPCEAAKPEWDKLKEKYSKSGTDIVVARVETSNIKNLQNAGSEPDGVPTFRHIHEDKIEEFTKGRTLNAFEEWIEKKTSKSGGKRRRTRRTKKRGGKWSLKYKRSINCRKPKGFSQKQYCKKEKNSKK